jgi:hypothetical protein
VTARENQAALIETMTLEPAASLMRRAGRSDLLRWRRPMAIPLIVGGATIVLKDQAPLIEQNMSVQHGWTFGDFVEFLNEHVFFWPGTAEGPIKVGLRLHAHYDSTSPLVLRIPTSALLAANPGDIPLFCAFNSGAPRMQNGKRVFRGERLFTSADEFHRREREVIEVAYRSSVVLPEKVMTWNAGEWTPLRSLGA